MRSVYGAPGRIGFQPEIALNYNGGNANGPWGMGWELSIPSIPATNG
ncbi:hypothetical protein KFU94_50785 [Chloroflexi bacterium TSY]|nr:hypothetical protein [Chloroflexi bacterium TSY]